MPRLDTPCRVVPQLIDTGCWPRTCAPVHRYLSHRCTPVPYILSLFLWYFLLRGGTAFPCGCCGPASETPGNGRDRLATPAGAFPPVGDMRNGCAFAPAAVRMQLAGRWPAKNLTAVLPLGGREQKKEHVLLKFSGRSFFGRVWQSLFPLFPCVCCFPPAGPVASLR